MSISGCMVVSILLPTNHRSHLQNIDMLVDNQQSRIASLHREYSDELQRLKEEYSTERDKMIKSHKFECNDLQDIMFAMEQEFNEIKTEALHDFQSQKDEIKNKVCTSNIPEDRRTLVL